MKGKWVSLLATASSQGWPTLRELSFFLSFFLFFLNIAFFGCTGFQMQHEGSSSLTRDQTWAPCSGSVESPLLDPQATPRGAQFLS